MFSCAYEDGFRLLCNAYLSLLPVLLKIGLSDFFSSYFYNYFLYNFTCSVFKSCGRSMVAVPPSPIL